MISQLCTHTQPHSHTNSHTQSHTLKLSHTLIHPHTSSHTLTNIHINTLTPSNFHTHILIVIHPYTVTHTSISPCTHILTHILTQSHFTPSHLNSHIHTEVCDSCLFLQDVSSMQGGTRTRSDTKEVLGRLYKNSHTLNFSHTLRSIHPNSQSHLLTLMQSHGVTRV